MARILRLLLIAAQLPQQAVLPVRTAARRARPLRDGAVVSVAHRTCYKKKERMPSKVKLVK